jgi:hypothetical protein
VKKRKWIFNLLLYVSLIFLVIYLVKFDYLKISTISFQPFPFILSLILLWSGFVFSTISWGYALKIHNIQVKYKTAIVSHGLSVFAKYIPGKLWVILGRAAYISRSKTIPVSQLSYISLKEQLLYILLGLTIAIIPTMLYFNQEYWVTIILLTIGGLVFVLFFKKVHDLFNKVLSKILKKEIDLPFLSFQLSLKLSTRIIIYWVAWTFAFYFFMHSISADIRFHHAYVFPLAVCYGVLAIFLPGGIGVREGIMTAYLSALGLELELAITIATLSRLWFITGEVFIFLMALVLTKRS